MSKRRPPRAAAFRGTAGAHAAGTVICAYLKRVRDTTPHHISMRPSPQDLDQPVCSRGYDTSSVHTINYSMPSTWRRMVRRILDTSRWQRWERTQPILRSDPASAGYSFHEIAGLPGRPLRPPVSAMRRAPRLEPRLRMNTGGTPRTRSDQLSSFGAHFAHTAESLAMRGIRACGCTTAAKRLEAIAESPFPREAGKRPSGLEMRLQARKQVS